MKRTFIMVVVAFALGASGAKKLIFVGWDTGDLAPAEIVRNAEALYEAGADGVGIYPRFKAEKGARTKRASPINGDREITAADVESYAAGANPIGTFGDNRNVPMPITVKNAWEALYGAATEPDGTPKEKWKHSDIKKRPYQVVRDVFMSIIEKGSLR